MSRRAAATAFLSLVGGLAARAAGEGRPGAAARAADLLLEGVAQP